LWWLNDDQKLPPIVRDILNGDDVIVFVSVASFWEISIKSASGKLCVEHDLYRELLKNDFRSLTIIVEHAMAVANLPRLHGDPFDRLLVTQAMLEGMTLLTHDDRLGAYGPCVRVV
jgi:PIN domain nuclease of toxin-antitoxin system